VLIIAGQIETQAAENRGDGVNGFGSPFIQYQTGEEGGDGVNRHHQGISQVTWAWVHPRSLLIGLSA
jgi:hypothetical protein